jgi:hypothetical protein
MTLENLKKQLILALLILISLFWLYIASKEKAGHFLVELSLHPGTVQLHQEIFLWGEFYILESAVTPVIVYFSSRIS